jgi:hypothetical protein
MDCSVRQVTPADRTTEGIGPDAQPSEVGMPSSRASIPGSGAPRAAAPASAGRVIGASLVGTSLEWYDFFLYLTATALVFDKLFFPQFDATTGTLLGFTAAAAGSPS